MHNGYRHDQRRFQRLKANLSMFYRLIEAPRWVCRLMGPSEFEGTMIDISQNGMAFLTHHGIPQGAVVSLKFYLFRCDDGGLVSFEDPLDIKAKVRSSLVWKINQYRLGVCFEDISVEDRFRIFDFICSTLKPYSMAH